MGWEGVREGWDHPDRLLGGPPGDGTAEGCGVETSGDSSIAGQGRGEGSEAGIW